MWRLLCLLILFASSCEAVEKLMQAAKFLEGLNVHRSASEIVITNEDQPTSQMFDFGYARMLGVMGLSDVALDYYERFRDERGVRLEDPVGYVRVLKEANQEARAIEIASQILEKEIPLEVQLDLALILDEMEQREMAQPFLEKFPIQQERLAMSATGTLVLARYFARIGDEDKAIALAKRVWERYPERMDAWQMLPAPKKVPSGLLATHYDRLLQDSQASVLDTMTYAKQWAAFCPEDPQPLIIMSDLYRQIYSPEQALEALERAHVLKPNDREILNQLLDVLEDPNLILDATYPELIAERTLEVKGLLRYLEMQ